MFRVCMKSAVAFSLLVFSLLVSSAFGQSVNANANPFERALTVMHTDRAALQACNKPRQIALVRELHAKSVAAVHRWPIQRRLGHITQCPLGIRNALGWLRKAQWHAFNGSRDRQSHRSEPRLCLGRRSSLFSFWPRRAWESRKTCREDDISRPRPLWQMAYCLRTLHRERWQ